MVCLSRNKSNIIYILIILSIILSGSFVLAGSQPKEILPDNIPEEIKTHLLKLYSINYDELLTSLNALNGMGEKAAAAVPYIIPHLDNNSWNVRRRAAFALGNIGDQSVKVHLKKLEDNDPNPAVRRSARLAQDRLRERHTKK